MQNIPGDTFNPHERSRADFEFQMSREQVLSFSTLASGVIHWKDGLTILEAEFQEYASSGSRGARSQKVFGRASIGTRRRVSRITIFQPDELVGWTAQ
jgi:hypothetical protein